VASVGDKWEVGVLEAETLEVATLEGDTSGEASEAEVSGEEEIEVPPGWGRIAMECTGEVITAATGAMVIADMDTVLAGMAWGWAWAWVMVWVITVMAGVRLIITRPTTHLYLQLSYPRRR
jgi:hypothetical protein